VKNQYFGDSRDALKYEFWLKVAEGLPGLHNLTFIPMLTPPDGTRHGSHRRYGATQRPHLIASLQRLAAEKQCVSQLGGLVAQLNWPYFAYKEREYFVDARRTSYFDGIPTTYLRDSCVLIDPDTGTQTGSNRYMQSRGRERYVLYSEIRDLIARSVGATVVIIYQHLQRNAKRVPADLQYRAERVAVVANVAQVAYVHSHDVAMLALSRNRALDERVYQLCRNFAAALRLGFGRYTSDA
jgi:hypothetical protein